MFRRPRLATLAAVATVTQFARMRARSANALYLKGRTVVVTGGSPGLGLEMARECARQGANVAICARDTDRLERAREDLATLGTQVMAESVPVEDAEAVRTFIAAVAERFGGIDVLFCNAGIISVAEFEQLDDQRFRDAMEVMFFGTLHAIRAALPWLKQSDAGRIAITSSIGGRVSMPYMVPYGTAKAALAALAEGLRAELAPAGITVTAIVPGLMRTGSYINAEFSGDAAGRELAYRAFTLTASTPLLTGDGVKAAHAYVRAMRRGEAEVMYPPVYQLVSRAHGVAPTLTTEVLQLIRRAFPSLGEDSTNVEGHEIDATLTRTAVWDALTTLGRDAGERMANEDAGTGHPATS